jgi:hypothetical protein
MPLTAMQILAVTPRGAGVGQNFTITGSGFGITAGEVVFDPIGVNLPAAIVSWTDSTIVATVPALAPTNMILTLNVVKAGGNDAAHIPFWVPQPSPTSNGLDYQYPAADIGAPNADDPFKFEARDFNRLLDLVRRLDPDGDGVVELAEALNDAGTPRTWADIVALVGSVAGGGTIVRPYAAGVLVNDVVRQRTDGLIDKADATSLVTGPAIGLVSVVDSPLVGMATVRINGDLSGFVGLTPGIVYLASKAPGGIVREDDTVNVNYPGGAGNFKQAIGVAGSATALLVALVPGAVVEV